MSFCITDDFTEAIKSFNKAIEINPNHSKAYNNLGNALLMTGNYNKAIENFEIAVKKNPTNIAWKISL